MTTRGGPTMRGRMSGDRLVKALALVALAAGVVLVAASYGVTRPAPVWWRLAGLGALLAAALLSAPASSRALLRDALGAFSPGRAGEGRSVVVALGLIVVAGAAVRLSFIGLDARCDESISFLAYASQPLGAVMETYPMPNHHHLHTFLMHGAWGVFGDGLAALRLPAFAAGMALIVAVFAAGRVLYDAHAGLIAAALTAGAAPMVEYSVNGRGYTMTWLAFLLLVALSGRLAGRRDPAAWALWIVCAALGLYTAPTMALPLATVVAWLASVLVVRRAWRRLAELAGACAATALAALALYWETLDEPGWDYVQPFEAGALDFAQDVWAYAHLAVPDVLRLVLAAAAVAGIVLHRRVGRQPVPLALVALALVPVFALALPHPPPFVRAWMYLVPVWFLAAGAGVVALARGATVRRRRLLPALAAVAAIAGAAGVVAHGAPYSSQDAPVLGADAFARWLVAHPGQRVITLEFNVPSLEYHLRRRSVPPGALVASDVELSADEDVPAPLLAVSRTRGDTLAKGFEWQERANERGIEVTAQPRLVRRFDELEIYTLSSP